MARLTVTERVATIRRLTPMSERASFDLLELAALCDTDPLIVASAKSEEGMYFSKIFSNVITNSLRQCSLENIHRYIRFLESDHDLAKALRSQSLQDVTEVILEKIEEILDKAIYTANCDNMIILLDSILNIGKRPDGKIKFKLLSKSYLSQCLREVRQIVDSGTEFREIPDCSYTEFSSTPVEERLEKNIKPFFRIMLGTNPPEDLDYIISKGCCKIYKKENKKEWILKIGFGKYSVTQLQFSNKPGYKFEVNTYGRLGKKQMAELRALVFGAA